MIIRRRCWCDVLVGCDVFGSDMPFESGSQCPEMEVAIDPAELFAGFDHAPAVHQRSAICASRQRLTLWEWLRQIPIMLSTVPPTVATGNRRRDV